MLRLPLVLRIVFVDDDDDQWGMDNCIVLFRYKKGEIIINTPLTALHTRSLCSIYFVVDDNVHGALCPEAHCIRCFATQLSA